MGPNETILISSGDVLEDFDHHFRVVAGPGAGKTYWLTNHIKNVVKKSDRLTSASRIACITYTNVGAEQITNSLGEYTDKVDVSTIHSFLYSNIVKPYAYLLKRSDGNFLINLKELHGHEEHTPSFSNVKKWIEDYLPRKFKRFIYEDNTFEALSDLNWEIDSSGQCSLKLKNWHLFPKTLLNSVFSYKELCWERGQIHHEDVLYFSHRILSEHPELRLFLSSKFPYIFLDEFQDTNPIQTIVLKLLAESGSTIGVIGDPAQSIYSFQGAEREDFLNFSLKDIVYYEIKDNRRSVDNIIKLLNHMRKGDHIQQVCLRKESGKFVSIVVCQNIDNIFKKLNFGEDYCVLTLRNEDVTLLKNKSQNDGSNVWDLFKKYDSSRQRFYYHLSVSIGYAIQNKYELALKEFLRVFRKKNGKFREPLSGFVSSPLSQRGIAFSSLEYFLSFDSLHTDLFTLNNNFSLFLSKKFENYNVGLKKITSGDIKKFSQSITLLDLVNSIKLDEDFSSIRTIHKAKGTEFKSVFVYMPDESYLNCILNPNLEKNEDLNRIFYVSFSRARDELFIIIPSLSSKAIKSLKELELNIEILNLNNF